MKFRTVIRLALIAAACFGIVSLWAMGNQKIAATLTALLIVMMGATHEPGNFGGGGRTW